MAEQRMKVRDKKVQKMTKDGLVEENLTDKSSVRVSNRASDVQMGRKQGEKEENLVDKSPRQSERSGKNIRPSVQKSRDAPELIRLLTRTEDLSVRFSSTRPSLVIFWTFLSLTFILCSATTYSSFFGYPFPACNKQRKAMPKTAPPLKVNTYEIARNIVFSFDLTCFGSLL